MRKFDLVTESPQLITNYYDLIVHSHVLEHVPCNIAYLFYHLSRTLKEDGYHIFCIPISRGFYDEYLGPLTPDEANKRFGQGDHVRRFGINDINHHIGSIMKLKETYSLFDYATSEEMNRFNIPETERTGLNGSTVFVAKKSDYLLSQVRS